MANNGKFFQTDALLPDVGFIAYSLIFIGTVCCAAAPPLFMHSDHHHHPAIRSGLLMVVYFIFSVAVYKKRMKTVGFLRQQLSHWICFGVRVFFLLISLILTSLFNTSVNGIWGYCVTGIAVFALTMVAQPSFDGGLLQGFCILPTQALRQFNNQVRQCGAVPSHQQNIKIIVSFVGMAISCVFMLGVQHNFIRVYSSTRTEEPEQQQDEQNG